MAILNNGFVLGTCPTGQNCTIVKSNATGAPECMCYGCTGTARQQNGNCTELTNPPRSVVCGRSRRCTVGSCVNVTHGGRSLCLGVCPLFGTRCALDRNGVCGCVYTNCELDLSLLSLMP
jgi:hypothetical protein